MAKRTQKAGATARYGARYGVSVRRRAGAAMPSGRGPLRPRPAPAAALRCVALDRSERESEDVSNDKVGTTTLAAR